MKIIKTLFCVFLSILLLKGNLFAQLPQTGSNGESILTGKLADSRNAPVAYATVALLRADGSVAGGGLTKEDGSFRISAAGPGSFRLRISALSFKEKTVEITISAGTVRDLGKIVVEPSSHDLQNVVIVGEKAVVEINAEKKTFNVEKNITTAGGSAADVLQNVPSVSVDNDGNPSLRGKSNVTLLIDGKPSTLLGSDAAAALQSLPASSIQSVEVITNPSAKYDAQGMGGIINIVTKKDRTFGLNGSATLGAGTRDKYNGSLNLNMRNEKWNFFLNSSLRINRNYSRVTTRRQNRFYDAEERYNDTFFRTFEQNTRKFSGWFSTAGAEYSINERNSISLTENLHMMGFGNDGTATTGSYGNINTEITNDAQRRQTHMLSRMTSLSSALDYKHKFRKEKRELTANLTYAHSWSEREQDYTTRYYDPQGRLLYGPVLQSSPGTGSTDNINAQADFTTPFLRKSGKLDAGLKAQMYRSVTSNDPVIAMPGSPPETDSTLMGGMDYTQNTYSAYTSFSDQVGKFGYQAGLRLEYSDYNGSTDAFRGLIFSNDFLNLFPSVFLSYDLPEDQKIYLSYTRRINRPGFRQLMPYVDLSDPRDTSVGNPALKPEFIQNTELSYSRKFRKGHMIMAGAYYQHTRNLIERYRRFYEDGTTFTQPQNLNEGITYGLELTGRAQWLPVWDMTANLNFFRNRINGSNVDTTMNNNGYSWFAKANSNVRLPLGFSLQLNGNYEAPKIDVQSIQQEQWWIDFAIRKSLAGGKGTIVFNVSDIFNTRKSTRIYDQEFYYQSVYHDRETRIANLSFTWKIGRQEPRRRAASSEMPERKERDNLRQGDEDGGGF